MGKVRIQLKKSEYMKKVLLTEMWIRYEVVFSVHTQCPQKRQEPIK